MSTAASDASIGELVKQLSEQSSRLARQEVELAKANARERIERTKSSLPNPVVLGVAAAIAAGLVLVVRRARR
jgi:hypothetical protein